MASVTSSSIRLETVEPLKWPEWPLPKQSVTSTVSEVAPTSAAVAPTEAVSTVMKPFRGTPTEIANFVEKLVADPTSFVADLSQVKPDQGVPGFASSPIGIYELPAEPTVEGTTYNAARGMFESFSSEAMVEASDAHAASKLSEPQLEALKRGRMLGQNTASAMGTPYMSKRRSVIDESIRRAWLRLLFGIPSNMNISAQVSE